METFRILGARAGRLLPALLEEIARRLRSGTRTVLLVPEQYTLQAERELVEGLKLPGLMDVEVLSPRRLVSRIREKGGAAPLPVLDAHGRAMALSRALRACKGELRYYARVAEQPGLPSRIAALMGDLEKAGLNAETLMNSASEMPEGASRAKQQDLARIWQTYNALIAGRFLDEAEQERDVTARLAQSGVLQNAAVYVYGFDVLSAQLSALLCEAAPIAAQVTVAFVMDAKDAPDGRIFLTQRRAAHQLIDALARQGTPWSLRYLPGEETGRDAALAHLERYLFTRQQVVFEGDASALRIHAAANPYAEAAYAAQTLQAWHASGIPWRKMAVALSESAMLPGMVDATLRAAAIPHYVARKDSALRHGLCRWLVGAARAAANGWRAQDVLDCAKSGFSPLTEAEAMRLENYALENGVAYGKWIRPFTRANAEEAEPLREKLMTPLLAFHARLKEAKDASESVEAAFRLLEDVGAYEHLMAREAELLSRGMQAEAAANRQVWQVIMRLFDQLHALLGGSRAAMKELAAYLEAGLADATISALPPEPDSVMVGEAGHLMVGEVDALLLMGVQDGVTASGQDSLLSEQERQALSDRCHRPVGLSRQEQNALRQADFYRTMALPRRFLTLTFSESGQDGAALRPAGLIADAQALFPNLVVTGGVTADGRADAPLSPQTALDGLSLHLRAMADGRSADVDAAWQEALRWLWQSEDWHDRTGMMLDGLTARVSAGELTREQTRRAFTQDAVSISRLESFAACPYRHFVDYGLKPVPRRDFVFAPDERGSFFHAAMQSYATLASALPDWPMVDDEVIDRLVDQAVAPLTETWRDGPLAEDALGRSLGESYVRTVRRSAWMFTHHARNSRFTTVGAEVRFGGEGELPPVILKLQDGRRVALRGVIDRIDRFVGDKGLYLRVVDYKSSAHALEPVRMWYGLQLQLLLYLKAATQAESGAMPAGAFYFTVKDPQVAAPEDVKAEAEKQIAREMRLKGVVLAETEVVEAMDADTPEYSLGKVFNKNGDVAENANAFDLREMHVLLEHAEKTAAALADHIRAGEIAVSPARVDAWRACDGCPYLGLCGRDPAMAGGEERCLEAPDKKELLRRMANVTSLEQAPETGALSRPGAKDDGDV